MAAQSEAANIVIGITKFVQRIEGFENLMRIWPFRVMAVAPDEGLISTTVGLRLRASRQCGPNRQNGAPRAGNKMGETPVAGGLRAEDVI